MSRQRGFTLLEVMIAIGIFALLGLGTYRMLATVMKADEVTREHEKSLRELGRAFASIDRDLGQALPRVMRDAYGDERGALVGELGATDGTAALEFSRAGWRNPLGSTRSQLQRVRWRLAGSTLERVYWSVLDQAVDSPPRVQKVLEGVSSVELRYLDDKGQWQEQWPPSLGDSDPAKARGRLPVAVELKLEHRHYGGLTRLYRLPEMGIEEQPSEGGTTPDDDKKPTPEPDPKPDDGKEKGA
ncbi:type II secretion system minor pseudopilin GspJ [Pseudomonas tohonis]|uniref:type II secretion system minor pseudopilin GspJ n=1 Tax=Pseudomonas tohonis TaxID=2725477 RepID=UPI001F176856|nr:type II secretion system minor pseudopilin GspJ [Pseudomonas tohonis]